MMMDLPASFYLLGHHFWSSGWMEVDLGGVVFIYHVDVDDSRRRGAAGYRRRARTAGRVQDGGAVWRHGDIDGRSGKVNAVIPLEDGCEEDGGSDFCGVCVGVR
jgi:hypothetical protein